MGPITLFDKSFLQSLSEDESVWFDNFFLTIICPLFFVETLADLDKSVRKGRTPEEEVGIIARKFPDMHSAPCVNHIDMCRGNLFGQEVPMRKQIPVPGGRVVKSGERKGVVYNSSKEEEAFHRWQNNEFFEVEHNFAKAFRDVLSNYDYDKVKRYFKKLDVISNPCTSLEDAKILSDKIVADTEPPKENDFYVARIWDNHFPNWREEKNKKESNKSLDSKLLQEMIDIENYPSSPDSEIQANLANADFISFKRKVRKKKGSWIQVREDIDK